MQQAHRRQADIFKEALQKDARGDPHSYIGRAGAALSLHCSTDLMLLGPAPLIPNLTKLLLAAWLQNWAA